MYDYLFFKSYQLAKKSKNFEDAPVLGGVWGIMLGVLFNIFTVILVFEKIFETETINLKVINNGKYFLAGLLLVTIIFCYKRKKRWLRIISKYEEKEKLSGKGINPIVVLIAYYIISFALGTLASMCKTGDLF